jgi:hypothetical protein
VEKLDSLFLINRLQRFAFVPHLDFREGNGSFWARRETMAKKQTRNKKLPVEELVEVLITRCLEALEKKTIKVTIADLIRMRDLRKQMAPNEPVRGEVTWIDGWE